MDIHWRKREIDSTLTEWPINLKSKGRHIMHCWTTRGYDGLSAPGARQRHHHFADRAVYDAAERAWLDHFIDGWLARRPLLAQAAE
jgi:hypothetical protein